VRRERERRSGERERERERERMRGCEGMMMDGGKGESLSFSSYLPALLRPQAVDDGGGLLGDGFTGGAPDERDVGPDALRERELERGERG